MLRATTACTFLTSQLPKVVRTPSVFKLLTWKCASRHNGVQFFNISTAKSGPDLVCFVHFDFKMCFAPQRRALFRHRNFQKWSDHGVFCTFWLQNVLRATTACKFSSLIWPAGSAPAALASLLFDPPEPQIIGKHSVSRLSYLFAHLCLLSSYSFSSDLLSSNLPLLSASALLCFSSVHIVGSLTSKFPSIKIMVCPTHSVLTHPSLNSWIALKILMLTPHFSSIFNIVDRHLEHQRMKHPCWQEKRWSDPSVFRAMVLALFWHWKHHWTYFLSNTFCCTHIQAYITGMKHSHICTFVFFPFL